MLLSRTIRKLGASGATLATLITLLLAGCGGGSSPSNAGGAVPTNVTGKFVDATVVGISYKCGTSATVSGTTTANGEFTCPSGQTVAFYVGDILLGSATASALVTPLDLVGTGATPAHPTVANIVRFLMSISSTDPASGTITITPAVIAAGVGKTVDFTATSATTINSLIPTLKPGATIYTSAQASSHVSSSINGLFAGNYAGTYSGAMSGTWSFTIAADGTVTGTTGGAAITGAMATSLSTGSTYAFTGTAGGTPWAGTLNVSTKVLNGTWNNGAGSSGTWTGAAGTGGGTVGACVDPLGADIFRLVDVNGVSVTGSPSNLPRVSIGGQLTLHILTLTNPATNSYAIDFDTASGPITVQPSAVNLTASTLTVAVPQGATGGVRITDKCAGASAYNVPAFNIALPAPAVTTVVAGLTQINLSWNAVAGAIDYQVYRATSLGLPTSSMTRLTTVTNSGFTWNDTHATAGTTYYYRVEACDAQGRCSAPNDVSATINIPIGLAASAVSSSQINLSWTAVTGASGYNVYRNAAAGVGITAANKITATPLTVASLNDAGLTADTSYFYTVTSLSAAGESLAAAEVSAKTQRLPGLANDNGVVTTLAGTPAVLGSADGMGAAASFTYPAGIAVDSSGHVYVAESYNHTIRKITPSGDVSTLAGSATSGCTNVVATCGSVDAQGAAARLYAPYGIAIDAAGKLYVADTNNSTIRVITPDGTVSTLAGRVKIWSSFDGVGLSAAFNQPRGIAVDSNGILYVADTGNDTIRKVMPDGTVSTLAGIANSGCKQTLSVSKCYVDATGTAARFSSPEGIAVDALGNLYVADTNNNKIRKITPDGAVTTIAANTPGNVTISQPTGIVVDTAGNLYVTSSNYIVKITPAGVRTIVAGGVQAGSANNTGNAAQFNTPYGIAIDAAGSLYVTDRNNSTIRKIQ